MNTATRHAALQRITPNDLANIIALAWWAWAMLPPGHNVFRRSGISFEQIHRIGDERVWGLAMLAVLCLLLAAAISGSSRLHILALSTCACLWAFVATMILVSNPISTGVGPYVGLALLSGWRATRLMGQARIE